MLKRNALSTPKNKSEWERSDDISNDEYVTIIAYLRREIADPSQCLNAVLRRSMAALGLEKVDIGAGAFRSDPPNAKWKRRSHDSLLYSRNGGSVKSSNLCNERECDKVNLIYVLGEMCRPNPKPSMTDYMLLLKYHAPTGAPGLPEDGYLHLSLSSKRVRETLPPSKACELIIQTLSDFDTAGDVYCGFAEIAKNYETSAGNFYDNLRMASGMLDREIEHEAWLEEGETRRRYVRRIFPLNLISKEHLDRLGGHAFLQEYEDCVEGAVAKWKNKYTRLLPSGGALLWVWPHLMEFSYNARKVTKQITVPASPAAWLHRRFRDAGMLI